MTFNSSNPVPNPREELINEKPYPAAMMKLSLSSIPYPSHIELQLNHVPIDLSPAFLPAWNGSLDRRWLEIALPEGIEAGDNTVSVELTWEGKQEEEGQGGKMLTSLEIIEHGGQGRFNGHEGFIGAFPTYSMDGEVTLRPVSDVVPV